ncbi:hypothetical protein [Actinomadura sp. WAC 06369]|uniref:hypothetical protein n=1 Tax=Actinomadura sp. WAC 06369 TaxID=2203193 RepID=UPI000F76C761|nr:hypothetical protein [Actinomadura sp. WAC 06369]RSN70201.1 hypothetical protein DMH08_06945 [Actinomadura sp. WAC 06369]
MSEIRVGKPHIRTDTPSHTRGVRMGNKEGNYRKQRGHHEDGTADARRSTGVNPKKHDAILPIMPNLPPG